MNDKLRVETYIPSAKEYDDYFMKFRAFMSANVSSKAKKEGVIASNIYKRKGLYFLRTIIYGPNIGIYYGNSNGTRDWFYSNLTHVGLRVAFQLVYNPESKSVKSCKEISRTILIYDNDKPEYINYGKDKKITSKAPIIEFGGKQYIWLNKEECKNGIAKTMQCWSLDLLEKAVPFDREGKHADFANATELLKQCERVVKEGCTKEELDMIVPVEISKEDDYETATPILDKFNTNKKLLPEKVREK